ncbi:MAG: phenylphosphate carboxylase subunit delta [Planctomycetes bacterium]|nr:phenylphosphate carboxylase subunit delta [Planctomycetota bacterium]
MKGDGLEPRLAELLRPVRLVALDVDGTLTDGAVTVSGGGEELRFSVVDGFGIKELQRAGLVVAWITGRSSPATVARAENLQVTELHLGQLHKTAALRSIQERLGIAPRETAAMGDDLPDLSLRPCVGLLAAPANARPEVLARADFVTHAHGGAGAVRELAEMILRAQGRWAAVVASYGA